MGTDELVRALRGHVGAVLPLLRDVADDIHAHPEVRFTEHHAAARLSAELERQGFEVVREYARMPTAFTGRWSSPGVLPGAKAPTVAIFCEFDALEGIGHACGHNLIAASGLGAAFALKTWLMEATTPATLLVVGSPGEEGGAGKVPMIEAGVLEGVDVAVMIHPGAVDCVDMQSLSRVARDIGFTGRASHAAAAPEKGVNALDAATLTLTAIGLLRQQLPADARVHAVVVDGGQVPNIIPETSAIRMFIRSPDQAVLLSDLVPRVEACAHGAAIATGCEVTIEERTPPYSAMVQNPVLAGLAEEAFALLGRVNQPDNGTSGSTDMGNVSWLVPSLHPKIQLQPDVVPHTREFAAAAGSEAATKTIADGAVVLAATAARVLAEPALLAEIAAAFREQVDDRGRC